MAKLKSVSAGTAGNCRPYEKTLPDPFASYTVQSWYAGHQTSTSLTEFIFADGVRMSEYAESAASRLGCYLRVTGTHCRLGVSIRDISASGLSCYNSHSTFETQVGAL